MTRAIRQHVTVGSGGEVTLHLPELEEGQGAEVIVRPDGSSNGNGKPFRSKLLQKYAGSCPSDDPRGSDNESIDEDLAREYGRGLDGDE